MSYRKILVPLVGEERDAMALNVASSVARQFSGHVVGLFVKPDATKALPYIGFGLSGSALQDMVNTANKGAEEAAQKAHAALNAVQGLTIVKNPGTRQEPTAEFRIVQGPFADVIERETRLSDLIVFGGLRGDEEGARDAMETVLMSGSRPILYTSGPVPETFGQKIAVGYDGSAAAAHALSAALPYLKRAASVQLFEVAPGAKTTRVLDPAREYLALHGITAGETVVDQGSTTIGESLTTAVQKAGCDLLVMGGYGHSRIHEFVLGGVTRHILTQQSRVPILMAH